MPRGHDVPIGFLMDLRNPDATWPTHGSFTNKNCGLVDFMKFALISRAKRKKQPIAKDRTKLVSLCFPLFSQWQTCKIHPNPLSRGPIGRPGSPRAPEFQPSPATATAHWAQACAGVTRPASHLNCLRIQVVEGNVTSTEVPLRP